MGPDHLIDKRRPSGRPARHSAHQLQNARLPPAAARRPRPVGRQHRLTRSRYIVPGEFHTYDGAPGHRRRHAAAPLGRTLGMADGDDLRAAVPSPRRPQLGSVPTPQPTCATSRRGVFRSTDRHRRHHRRTTKASKTPACRSTTCCPPPTPTTSSASTTPKHSSPRSVKTPTSSPRNSAISSPSATAFAHPLTRSVLEAGGSRRGPNLRDAVAEINNEPRTGANNTCGTLSSSKKRSLNSSPCCRSPAATSAAANGRCSRSSPALDPRSRCVLRSVARPPVSGGDSALSATERSTTTNSAATPPTSNSLPPTAADAAYQAGWRCGHRSPRQTPHRPGNDLPGSRQPQPRKHPPAASQPQRPRCCPPQPNQPRTRTRPTDDSVPVLVTTTEDDAKNSVCPACGERKA